MAEARRLRPRGLRLAAALLAATGLLLPASDQGTPSALQISVPEITSVGPFTVAEGTTEVTSHTATDDDTPNLTWSTTGGDDSARFELGEAGVLAFTSAPD